MTYDLITLTETNITFHLLDKTYISPVEGDIKHLYKLLDGSSSVLECIVHNVIISSEKELSDVIELARNPEHSKVMSAISDNIFYWEYIHCLNELHFHPSFFTLHKATYYV